MISLDLGVCQNMNQNNTPLYQQLADNIREKIVNGQYRISSKIASEREMSQAYNINRLTVRKAIQVLIDEGYLISIQGKGTFVAKYPKDKKVALGSSEQLSLSAQMRQSGFNSTREVIKLQKIALTDELKDYFPLAEGCYQLTRLSRIDNIPYALQICHFPDNYFSNVDRFDFANDSLYNYMESQGHKVNYIISNMNCTTIPNEYTNILKSEPNKIVFHYQYFGFDEKHTLVEFTQAYYLPEYISFKYTMTR